MAKTRLVEYPTYSGGTVKLKIGPGEYQQARRWMILYKHGGSQWPHGVYFCTRKEARAYVKGKLHLRVEDCETQNWDWMWDDSNTD